MSRFLGAIFSGVSGHEGDEFDRPSSGGGGFGDPLERDPALVLEDVIDDYVSLERARKDYGVVINAIDPENLRSSSTPRRPNGSARRSAPTGKPGWRMTRSWSPRDTVPVRSTCSTPIRRYGVIIDQRNGQLLSKTTEQFREMMLRRTAAHWA